MKLRALVPLTLVLAGGALSAQAVHVVDLANGPGTDFVDLTSALATAAEGDVVLVREGTYSEFLVLDGKGVIITADAGADVSVAELTVRNLAADQAVTLRGLDFVGGTFLSLILQNNDGAVWVEESTLAPPFSPFGSNAVSVSSCSTVVFNHCVVVPSAFGATSGLAALPITNSSVYLYETQVTGFSPGPAVFLPVDGCPAVSVSGGSLYIHASTVRGGNGSDAVASGNGGNGGAAVVVNNASTIEVIGSTVEGGAGGLAAPGGVNGQPGLAFLVNSGTVTTLPNTAHLFATPSPLREGGTTSVDFVGDAGDLIYVLLASDPRALASTSAQLLGPLHLEAPLRFVPFGVLPASGTFNQSFSVPDLGPAAAAAAFYMQGLFISVLPAELAVGSPTQVQILDASF